MSEQELLQAGLSAFKSGDKKKAASILSQLVKEYPNSERGWYLLGMSVSAAEQRQYCFRQVLKINPNNPDAKKQLALHSPLPPAPAPQAWTSPPRSEPITTPIPKSTPISEPVFRSAPPFIPYDTEQDKESVVQSPSQQNAQKALAKKKKKGRQILIATVAASVLVLICASIAVISMLNSTAIIQPMVPAPQSQQIASPTPLLPAATITPAPPTQLPTPLPKIAYTPLYEETPCPFETPIEVSVTCGFVTVPENRTGDPTDTIQLAVAVYHSTSNNPAPDPVVFLQGGPGGEALTLSADAYSDLVEPFLGEHDFVTFDQRGTGLSDPSLKCDELDKVYRQDIYGMVPAESREYVYKNALLSCNGLLQANGVDFKAYSTVESAADLRDIVKLLGYEKVNLYGASYGTRLALVTMRNHPEIVRSAILDSVVPVESNVLHEYPSAVESALSQLFTSCAASPECNLAYPNLETVFWELVNELDENPVTLSTSAYPMGTVTETVDGYYLLSVILGLEKSSHLIDAAPQTIYRVKEQDYSTLTAAQYALPYALDGINPGLYISMICREHVLATTQEELQATTEKLNINDLVWRPFYGDFAEMFEACKSWKTVGPDLGEKDATISDIPSLIIEGAYDPATPPFYGKQVAEDLSNNYYFEFPNMGHVPTAVDDSGCAMQIALDFIENPGVEPDRSCLNAMEAVKFLVPYTGTPAIKLTRQDTYGVSLDVPTEWYYDDGFFVRYSSPFDVTQVGAMRAAVTIQDLKDYFSSSVYGYRGLDAAPIEAGVREANGKTWRLYYSTSNGHPVDVAATENGRTSIIVTMFSHMDEHDAMYRTVFLPMVDSAR
ncbi:MAG: alpha/beta fold hydrolase [Anaerolineales bacterium]|nr:alpha/beta fold hydrolase [Anaerolineales bacterium]